MESTRKFRLMQIAIVILCGLMASGCGEMARQAVKSGLYTYVGGSLTSTTVSTQLADLLARFFTQPSTTGF